MSKNRKETLKEADVLAAKRLKEAWKKAKKNGLKITQEQVAAEEFGASQGLVSQYLNGVIPLNFRALLIFSRVLGIEPTSIRNDLPEQAELPAINSGNGESAPPATKESQRIKIHAYDIEAIDGEEIDPAVHTLIDEVDIMLAAGSGTVIPEYVETKFRMAYRLDWFQRERIDPKHCKLMRVSGDSMESLLFDGDRVLIDLSNTRVRDGKVYAIAIGGEAKIKRLFNQRDGGLRIVSDNPNKDIYPDEIVPPDEMHTVAVIGRVVDKSGRGGL